MKSRTPKISVKHLLSLHTVLLLYSLCSVCSKNASAHDFFSTSWILWYSLSLTGLFVYAILWQQVLKRMPLSIAYANKAVVIIWGIIWENLFFQEAINTQMLIGAVLIIFGIVVVGSCDE